MMQVSSGGPSMTERHRPPDLSPLAALFVADRDQVRREPLEAAHLLRGLTIAGTHPALILDEPLSSAEIVSLFLDGIRTTAGRPPDEPAAPPPHLPRPVPQPPDPGRGPHVRPDDVHAAAAHAQRGHHRQGRAHRRHRLHLAARRHHAASSPSSRSRSPSSPCTTGHAAAMAFGRDVRGALFHRVTDFSAQDVAHYGAPSLITRITNDVTQVQILVLMSCTLLVAAPITIVGGIILRRARGRPPLAAAAREHPGARRSASGLVIIRMVPQFQEMQERIDRINEVLREQITGIRVVRAFVREPDEAEAVRRRQRRAHGRRRSRPGSSWRSCSRP